MGPGSLLRRQRCSSPRRTNPVLLVVPDERRLAPAVSDLEFAPRMRWGSSNAVSCRFPAFALDPYRGLSPHLDVTAARVRAASRPPVRRDTGRGYRCTGAALLYRTASPEILLARG